LFQVAPQLTPGGHEPQGLTNLSRRTRWHVSPKLLACPNSSFIVAYLIAQHGTQEQQQRLLPKMASGEIRGAFSMSEPECGSDVAAIKTRARAADGGFVLDGQKMWLTTAARPIRT
jgi:alkylation response protein AidB-like acyl-CoA dehydrogenase